MKVSILVAVYNAEGYLPACLDSLTGQTHRDVEIICIDDASTDGSWRVLQEYAGRDGRIRLLRQPENGGPARARNAGLAVATGDYVTMVDSDDWLAPDAVELLCRAAREEGVEPALSASGAEDADSWADCVMFHVIHHEEETGREEPYVYRTSLRSFSGREAFELSLDWSIHGLYMIRADIHRAYPYDDSLPTFSDDNITTRAHYLHSRRVVRSDARYYYRHRAGSISTCIDTSRLNLLRANLIALDDLHRAGADRDLLAHYETCRWLNLVGLTVFYYDHFRHWTAADHQEFATCLRHIHSTITTSLLPLRLRLKFGYIPFKRCYPLFKAQVALYAFLRRLLGRG